MRPALLPYNISRHEPLAAFWWLSICRTVHTTVAHTSASCAWSHGSAAHTSAYVARPLTPARCVARPLTPARPVAWPLTPAHPVARPLTASHPGAACCTCHGLLRLAPACITLCVGSTRAWPSWSHLCMWVTASDLTPCAMSTLEHCISPMITLLPQPVKHSPV